MSTKQFPLVPRFTSLKNAARLVKNPVPVVEETAAKLGPTYFFHMGGKTKGLITQDLEVVEHILLKNHKNYQKSPLQSDVLASYIGHGLLTNNGNSWLRQRRLIQPAFSKKNINALSKLISDEVGRMLDAQIGNGGQISLSNFTALLTFHIIARAIFSDEVTHEEILSMRDNVERVQKMIILQVRQPFKKWYYELTGKLKHHKKLANEARDLVKRLAHQRRETNNRKNDILQFLLDTRYEDTGEAMTIDQLGDELLILMVAGHETTAHSLTWTLFLLNRHPHTLEKLLTEINAIGDDYMSYFDEGSYLMAVIKESMRLYPPAWVIDRIGLEDDEIGKREIPKDTIIMNFIYGLHRRSEYWEQPNDFRPERFLKNSKPAAYFPFGAGPRLCIGNHFAYLEIVISLVKLLTRYRIQDQFIPDPGIRPLITLQPAKEIWMGLEKK